MGGEGSIAGMIASLKNNRILLKNRHKAFNKDKLGGFSGNYHQAIHMKKASKTQLERLRKRLSMERKQETIRLIVAIIITLSFCCAIVIITLWLIEKYI